MEEIDLSTLLLIGIDEEHTRVYTIDSELVINKSAKKIIEDSCKFFGSSLNEKVNMTKRLVKINSKSPIVIEETRNIIFFPLKSTREKNNIWISFNNLEKYEKKNDDCLLYFKCGKQISIKFSFYIIDNQVTRSLILDYELNKRRKSLEK